MQPAAGAAAATATTSAPSGTAAPPMSGVDALMKESQAQQYWVKRLIALIVDGIIIGIVALIIWGLAAGSFFLFGGGFGFFGAFFGVFALVLGILLILYFPLMETSSGATLGKKVLGLKVVSKTGSNPTFVEAFVRNVSKIYWLLLLLDVIVGLAITKGYQQKYSDHIMGTSVVPA